MGVGVGVIDPVGKPHAERGRCAEGAEFALLDACEKGCEEGEHGADCQGSADDESGFFEEGEAHGLQGECC